MTERRAFTIYKRFGIWQVYVRAGVITTNGFTAPFHTYEAALNYVRFWLARLWVSRFPGVEP